ncbi:DUF535 family protein, partial [Salmonella enterica]|uniref:DUF535 family protein n=1 Tax=Salmonella enterica TaxID=28901 RepID=UPI001125A08B
NWDTTSTNHHGDNEFWASIARPKIQGNSSTPQLAIAHQRDAQLVDRKRAEYRRRYALLDSVVEQVPATFKR